MPPRSCGLERRRREPEVGRGRRVAATEAAPAEAAAEAAVARAEPAAEAAPAEPSAAEAGSGDPLAERRPSPPAPTVELDDELSSTAANAAPAAARAATTTVPAISFVRELIASESVAVCSRVNELRLRMLKSWKRALRPERPPEAPSRIASRRGRAGREVVVVRGDDHRRAVLGGEPGEQVDHVGARLRVEVAGRLVGEDHPRLDDERARDRDALLLAAGELARQVAGAVGEADLGEQRLARGRAARRP